MKKLYFLVACLMASGSLLAQFSGNGKTGFGGTVGQGSMTVSDDRSTITFTLNRGGGDLNDAVVIYIDSRSGGFSSTANFTDDADGLRKAISGKDGENRASLTFPTGFLPDFAIAFDKDFAGIWELVESGPHNYQASANLTPGGNSSSPTFTVSTARTNIGSTSGTINFKFLVTYISETAYRSNEFIGDGGPAANPGFGDYTATSFSSYTSVLPVNFSNVSVRNVTGKNVIDWSVSDQRNADHYQVLRSANGNDFSAIGSVSAKNGIDAFYTFADEAPLNGVNYYRIRMVDKSGKISQSEVVSTKIAATHGLSVYAANGRLNVVTDAPGKFQLTIVNSIGQPVFQQQYHQVTNIAGSTPTPLTINLNNKYAPGIYTVVVSAKDYRESRQFLIK